MRWALTLNGEHVEGVEAKARFDAIVAEFSEKLHSNGFLREFCDCTLDSEGELAASRKAWPLEFGVWPGVRGFTEEVEIPTEIVEEKPLTLADIQARIREEKEATGGNKILSQKELAARIGVSRSRIRQALG